jgi:acyl-CoA thioester hydrolase
VTFEFPLRVRYMEADAQGVVFNGWYLTYFDEAFAAFLDDRGLNLKRLLAAGFDTQLVHAEIDWRAPLRWQDDVLVAVSVARLGRTSVTVDFAARQDGGEVACAARIVYVVIATDGTGKREIPPILTSVLQAPAVGSGL